MTEYENELIKELLGEARKAKGSLERLEALAARLLAEDLHNLEKKDVIPPDDMPEPEG
jgi:hypothetical protein